MIDIISSSIRLGKLLREHKELNSLYVFFAEIVADQSNPWMFEYIKLLSDNFSLYGLYAFDFVDKIIEQNLSNEDDFAKNIISEIKSHIVSKENYKEILDKSKKYGTILNKYIAQLLCQTNDYLLIELENISLKIQQCSNELSTAVLRSGVLSWIIDPKKVVLLKKEMSFVSEYESKTAAFDHLLPYNINTLKVINSCSGNRKKIAQSIENIKFIQFLTRCGILQGFFFELFEIFESNIIKIKEIYKDQSIHPVIIKTNLIYPSNHLFLFKYTWGEQVAYLLTKRMTIHFTPDEASTTLYGYCYPTNEYSLLKID